MMMKMLEAGGVPVWLDGVRAADSQNPKGYYELERVKDLDKPVDKGWVREGRGRAVKIISSLLVHLPPTNNYRVLFMRRNLDEILASQTKMLVDRGEATDGVSDEDLRKFYETHLWRVNYFLKHQPAFSALDIDYTDALVNPGPVSERISAFLQLPLNVQQMSAVVDEQLYRNRRA